MKTGFNKIRLWKYAHFILAIILFYFAWLMFRYGKLSGLDKYGFRYNYFMAVMFAMLFLFFARTYNAYMVGAFRIRRLVFNQVLSQFFALGIIYFGTAIAWNMWYHPLWMIVLFFVFLIFDCGWSFLANNAYFRDRPPEKVAIIYREKKDIERFAEIFNFPFTRQYDVDKTIENPVNIATVLPQIEGYSSIFVSGLDSELRNELAKYCTANSVKGYFIPHIGDVLMAGSYHLQNFSSPVLTLSRKSPNPEYLVIKRAFDIFTSLCGIVVLSPLMLVIAIAIKLYDRGPVIYSQTRLTKDGKLFRIYKFRSMRVDAEADGKARLSTENDDRITPIGKIIRSCRFDEIPQLFNILKGDMTIVGPRPERPEFYEEYKKTLPDFPLRLQVKAGLTGYAQVYGKYCTSPYEKLEFDLLYMNNMNIVMDLRLMFATVSILFKKESTEGFEEDMMIPGG